MKRIPIAAAQRIAEAYDYDQVVIIARKVGPQNVGGEHVTTYGIDKANCDVAARIGNFIKHKIMGWPEPEKAGNRLIVNCTHQRIAIVTAATTGYPPPYKRCLDCNADLGQADITAAAGKRERGR